MTTQGTYDYLVVGAGMFGATFAWHAKCAGKSVLVVEQREKVGGNCSTINVEGIHVHEHGPHIFHCDDKNIWEFVQRFATFNSYTHRVKSVSGKDVLSMPINMMTLHQIFGVTTPAEASAVLKRERINIESPRNLEEWILSQVGQTLYERLIYGYTRKQWDCEPSKLSSDIIKRLPIRLTWDDNYFNDRYQGIPINGYSSVIEGMLDGCDVHLGTDFNRDRDKLEALSKRTVYTGAIDAFYNHVLGHLGYRSLRFDTEVLDVSDYQGLAQLNYADVNVPWTRVVEHKHFNPMNNAKTVVTKEFSRRWEPGMHPYYPINNDVNSTIYKMYVEMSKKESRTLFGGRLANYRYMDMHQVIGSAMTLAKRENVY